MNAWKLCIMVLATVALNGAARAGEDKTGPQLQVEVDLIDGSRIVGTPSIESVPVETPYAKMDVQLKQILTLRIGDDHETATLELRNGDKLKGVVSLATIQLETILGKVSVDIGHIRELQVVRVGQPLPDELRQGMVLHYAFDLDEGDTVRDQSGRNNNAKASGSKWTPQGREGGACEFTGATTVEPGSDPLDLRELTVSLWFKTSQSAAQHTLLAKHVPGYANGYFLMLDWSGGNPPPGKIFFYHSAPGSKFGNAGGAATSAQAGLNDGKWHHIVAGRSAAKVFMCVDGVYNSVDGTGEYVSSPAPLRLGALPGCAGFTGLMDEVMIFNRALSDSEVRQIYDAQK
jgi:hypothetical protein